MGEQVERGIRRPTKWIRGALRVFTWRDFRRFLERVTEDSGVKLIEFDYLNQGISHRINFRSICDLV